MQDYSHDRDLEEAASNNPRTYGMRRGTVVRAEKLLDQGVAHVMPGDYGVVFETADAHGDANGPMVRWVPAGTCCNVYDGDVREA